MPIIGFTLLQACYFALALFGVATWLQRRGMETALSLGCALLALSGLAMCSFWLSWLLLPHFKIARFFQFALLLPVLVAAILGFRHKMLRNDITPPLTIFLISTLVLTVWTHGAGSRRDPLLSASAKWVHDLPGDNTIPFDFARAMDRGGISSPLHADWLSSDRPPLQTALYLLSPGHIISPASTAGYQAAGIALQMFALLGIWVLMSSLGADRRLAAAAMVTTFLTPLVLVNGSYVWPKLLAAALLLVVCAIQLSPSFDLRRNCATWGVAAGLGAALAMLSHGSSGFAIIGIGVAALLLNRLGSARYVLAAASMAVLVHAPWSAYQTYADPPGNRLLKWHFAGVQSIDSRSTRQAIVDGYAALSRNEVVSRRVDNLSNIFSGITPAYAGTMAAAKLMVAGDRRGAAKTMRQVRIGQFFSLIPGTGVLGLALFLLPFGLLDKRLRPLATAILATLTVWVLLLFEPGTTTIHQGSLMPELCLIVGAIICLDRLGKAPLYAALFTHGGLTIFQYAH
jgi:hypothetical protein